MEKVVVENNPEFKQEEIDLALFRMFEALPVAEKDEWAQKRRMEKAIVVDVDGAESAKQVKKASAAKVIKFSDPDEKKKAKKKQASRLSSSVSEALSVPLISPSASFSPRKVDSGVVVVDEKSSSMPRVIKPGKQESGGVASPAVLAKSAVASPSVDGLKKVATTPKPEVAKKSSPPKSEKMSSSVSTPIVIDLVSDD